MEKITNLIRLELLLSGFKAHSSLFIGGKIHGRLRRIYRKIHHDYPHIPIRYVLKIALKSMNVTINERAFVSSRLVLGILLLFPIRNTDLPNQKDEMNVFKKAKAEINSSIAERRVLTTLT